MPNEITPALFFGVVGALTSLATLLSWILKGQDYVEAVTLRAMRSEDGRDAILRVTKDHIDAKLDALSKAVETVGRRVEDVGSKLERRLDKHDSEAQTMNVRVTLLEKRGDQ